MEKYGFVYIWRDRKHNRYYIGSHWGTENDGYVCSSPWMLQAYKRRPNDFRRKILIRVNTDRKTLLEMEEKYLNAIQDHEVGTKYYNLCRGGTGHWSAYPEKVKTLKEKISIKTKEAMWSDNVRENYLKGLETRDNRSSDPEVRKKRSLSMRGKNKEEWKWKDNLTKAHNSLKGKMLSEEHKQKVKDAGVFKTLNATKVSCIHCGKLGNIGSINRWHNDKCVYKG